MSPQAETDAFDSLHPDRSEPFEEHAQDLDAWTAATGILAAAGGYQSSSAVLEAGADRLDVDSTTLDRIAWLLSVNGPWGQDIRAEIVDLIRSTGRRC